MFLPLRPVAANRSGPLAWSHRTRLIHAFLGLVAWVQWGCAADSESVSQTDGAIDYPAEEDCSATVENAAMPDPGTGGSIATDDDLTKPGDDAPIGDAPDTWFIDLQRAPSPCEADIEIVRRGTDPIVFEAGEKTRRLECRPGWVYTSVAGIAVYLDHKGHPLPTHDSPRKTFDCDLHRGLSNTWHQRVPHRVVTIMLDYGIEADGRPFHWIEIHSAEPARPLLGKPTILPLSPGESLRGGVLVEHQPAPSDTLPGLVKASFPMCEGEDAETSFTPVTWALSAHGHRIPRQSSTPGLPWRVERGRATVCRFDSSVPAPNIICEPCSGLEVHNASCPPPSHPSKLSRPSHGWRPPALEFSQTKTAASGSTVRLRLKGKGVLEVREDLDLQDLTFGAEWIAVDDKRCSGTVAERHVWLRERTVSPYAQWPHDHPLFVDPAPPLWLARLHYVDATDEPQYYQCSSDGIAVNTSANAAPVHVSLQPDSWNWWQFSRAALNRPRIRRCLHQHARLEVLDMAHARRCPEYGLLAADGPLPAADRDGFLVDCNAKTHGVIDHYFQARFYPFWCGGPERTCTRALVELQECSDASYVTTAK